MSKGCPRCVAAVQGKVAGFFGFSFFFCHSGVLGCCSMIILSKMCCNFFGFMFLCDLGGYLGRSQGVFEGSIGTKVFLLSVWLGPSSHGVVLIPDACIFMYWLVSRVDVEGVLCLF